MASTGQTRQYDLADRVTVIEDYAGATTQSPRSLSHRYTMDRSGNVEHLARRDARGADETWYGHDQQSRLTDVCKVQGCPTEPGKDPLRTGFGYDAVGNRTSVSNATGTTTYSYDASDQLVSSAGPLGSVTYEHDLDGNLTRAGSRSYRYDLANRMTSAQLEATTWTYGYDGDGNRMSAQWGPEAIQRTQFVWDESSGVPDLVVERLGDGIQRRFAYGNGLQSLTVGGQTHQLHSDSLGSVTAMSAADGSLERLYDHDEFGEPEGDLVLSPLAPENSMRFTGQYLDPTGLYHLRARQYDPQMGRFTARDPLPPEEGKPCVSSYAYVDNRPQVLVDPTGMRGSTIAGVARCVLDYAVDSASSTSRFLASPGAAAREAWNGSRVGAEEAGGGAGARLNQFNPAYHALNSGQATSDAVAAGDGYGAGYSACQTAAHAVDTVALATGFTGVGKAIVSSGRRAASGRPGRLADESGAVGPGASRAAAATRLEQPQMLRGASVQEIDELARAAGYERRPGKASGKNPATRYYKPGTRESDGFRILHEGVPGQPHVKAGPYLRFFGGKLDGVGVPLRGHPDA